MKKRPPNLWIEVNQIFQHYEVCSPNLCTLSPRGQELLREVLMKYGIIDK